MLKCSRISMIRILYYKYIGNPEITSHFMSTFLITIFIYSITEDYTFSEENNVNIE